MLPRHCGRQNWRHWSKRKRGASRRTWGSPKNQRFFGERRSKGASGAFAVGRSGGERTLRRRGGCRAMLPRHCGRQNWRHWSKRKRGASRRTWGSPKNQRFFGERRSKGASGAFAVGRSGGERTLRRRGGCRATHPPHCGRQNWRHWSQCIFNSMWKADQGDGYTAGALVFLCVYR